jgi:hypothetical protein
MPVSLNEKVFFYCCPIELNWASFQHNLICLAEGFRELGIPFHSNINYWQLSSETDEHLFQYDPKITPDDCSIVILQTDWFLRGRPFPQFLFHPKRDYITVYIDCYDGENTIAHTSEFRQFDFIFRTHFNQKFSNPSNFYPWAFGLSGRILSALGDPLKFKQRKNKMLVNFRASKHPHSVRKFAERTFLRHSHEIVPIDSSTDWGTEKTLSSDDALHRIQTGGRHFPAYYKRLKESSACACFGGFFVSPIPSNQSLILSRLLKRCLTLSGFKSNQIMQWDSWRFWEALAAGCPAFQIDLEKYGALLPVMPQNWEHYIGVDFDNMDETLERLTCNLQLLESISSEGREWALKHYSPLPTAQRFLKTIQQKSLLVRV